MSFQDYLLSLKDIFNEIIALFRIIQRCSMPFSFQSKLNINTKNYFAWATDLFVVIFNNVIMLDHLTDENMLIFYAFGFYMAYPILFLGSFTDGSLAFALLFSAFFLAFSGFGIYALINGNMLMGLLWGLYPLVFIPLSGCCCCVPHRFLCPCIFGCYASYKIIRNDGDAIKFEYDKPGNNFGLSFLTALLMFTILVTPNLYRNDMYSIIAGCCIAFIAIVGFIIGKWYFDKHPEKVMDILSNIYTKISSLLVIPIIGYLIGYNQENGFDYAVTVYVIVVPLLSSFVTKIFLIIAEFGDFMDDYKEGKHYFEIFDTVMKYAYAIFEGLNIVWGGIAVEIITIIVIVIVRPYILKNKYFLSIGECIVVLMTNCIGQFYNGKLSLVGAMCILGCAFLPVIASFYIYLIFDNGKVDKDNDYEINDYVKKLVTISCVFSILVGSIIYGYSACIIYDIDI